jgi:DNA-binding beta-propeller fold protein YncE
VAALVALCVCAVTVTSVSNAPADPAAHAAKKKGKKKKKKRKKTQPQQSETQRAVFVGNNWDGTADVLVFNPPANSGPLCANKRGNGKRKKGKSAAKRRGCKKGKKKGKRRDATAAKRRGCKKGKKRGAASRKRRGCRRAGSTTTPGSFRRLARINIIPDYAQRIAEIQRDPQRLGYFLGIRALVGEGNDQFVDDMYSTPDGRLLVVSRPSFRDVVGINLATRQIVWRFVVAGQRSDHMGVSPDGKYVAVSASTGNVVHILDMQTGQQVGVFPSGDSPHENTYSDDGNRIYHASIGLVYTPADLPLADTTKGARHFQIVDAHTRQILRRVDMGDRLEQAGYPGMSSAVRPMAITPDERFIYLQVSFFHGVVEYDVVNDKVTRIGHLPNFVPNMPREQYLLDSAHHGIAINDDANKLCVAGTMSDYAAIVERGNFADYTILQKGNKPYWSTTDDTGDYCFVSWSGTDAISAISYRTEQEVARIQVGKHPQRVRTGDVRRDWVASLGG